MKILLKSILIFSFCTFAIGDDYLSGYEKELIYENNFNSFEDIDDWVIEGPGKIYFADNKMMLIPDAQQYVYRTWEKHGRRVLHPHNEYYAAVEQAISKYNPDMLEKIKNPAGNVAGGHIVCWNKAFETADSYIVEYDFKPLSPIGLGIIFFSAKGVNGEDPLSDKLLPRHGIFSQYLLTDINSYHISYWANNAAVGKRGTCNLRKNVGAFCLANGIDPTAADLDYEDEDFDFQTYRIRLVKIDNQIRFYINDILSIDWTDNRYNNIVSDEGLDDIVEENVDTGEVLGSGRIALRQMVGLIGKYDNFRVYNLKPVK